MSSFTLQSLYRAFIALLVCGLAAASLWTSGGALKTGYCDFRLSGPRAALDKANTQAIKLPLAQWQELTETFKSVHTVCANDAQIPADLANLYLIRAQAAQAVPQIQHFYAAIAQDYLYQSLKYRPGIAQNWANLALIKAQTGQFDDAFFSAVNNAFQLAPRAAGVLQSLALATLPYPALQENALSKTIQTQIAQLPSRQKQQLERVLKAHGIKDGQ